MIVNIGRRALALLVALATLALTASVSADQGDSLEVEAQRLVHILRYVAADYGAAVENGAIKNEAEYAEQLTLIGDAAKIATRLQAELRAPENGALPNLPAQVAKVRSLVEAKSAEAPIVTAIADVRSTVMVGFRLVEAPKSAPDSTRGKSLYTEHCATCHGQTGHADTTRAATLNPRPSNFQDPEIGDALTPLRVSSTVRFGINGTSMIPFTFLSDDDRWALGFYVAGLRHGAKPADDAPTYTLAELAVRSDVDLRADLKAAGIADDRRDAILADLRRRAPYEDRASKSPLLVARARLDRAKTAMDQGQRDVARRAIIDAYLEGIEPAEGPLRSMDSSVVNALEEKFVALRARLEAGAPTAEVNGGIDALLAEVMRADLLLAVPAGGRSFFSTAISSGGIVLREGVEAALLIAALLGIAAQAGLADRRRFVHYGWISALVLGAATWVFSSRIIAISGASREMIEGVTALLAAAVLFYVSYSLLAKTEVARWMKFLRRQISPRRAAMSLFGVAFLAAYREAFETVLFYQALLASNASTAAALAGAIAGAVLLTLLVTAYSRAGRFAPPQLFFKVSSYLLYALAIVFAGQGIAALQLTGVASIHPLAIPTVAALGIHPTVETSAAQGVLIAFAILAMVLNRRATPAPSQQPVVAKPVS